MADDHSILGLSSDTSNQPAALPDEDGPFPGRFGRIPPLVVAIIVLNVSIFLLLVLAGALTDTAKLLAFGALYRPLVRQGEYWRLLTSEFLHGGLLHLAVNMYSLWILGRLLEPLYGTLRFGVIYLISGLSASLMSVALHEVVSVGASGAIFGIAGAMVVAGWRYDDLIPTTLTKAFGTGVLPFVLYNIFYGFAHSGIDNAAHLGGALGGAICALVFKPHEERPWTRRTAVAGLVALVVLVFGVHLTSQVNFEVEAKLQHALELQTQGKAEEARSELDALRKTYPADPRPLCALALLDMQAGKSKDAEDELRAAIRLAPDTFPAHWLLGAVLADSGKLDEAIAELRQASRLNPGSADVHNSLGIALNENGDAKGALEEFQKAQQASPDRFLAPTRLFAGHTNRIWILRFSRDSRMLASGSLDETVKVWDIASGRLLADFKHRGEAFPVDFSPDGKLLATGSTDFESRSHAFKLWAVSDKQEVHGNPSLPDVEPIAFSPDWRYLASYKGNGKIQLWDLNERRATHVLSGGDSPFQRIAKFSPDGRLFAAPGAANTAKVWEVEAGKELFTVHGDPAAEEEGIVAVFFSADGALLTVVDSHKNVKIFDTKTGRESKTIPVDLGGINIVEYVGLSPDGRWLAAESVGGAVLLTDLAQGRTLTLSGHRHLANAVAFSPDGAWLATASWKGEVKLWRVPSAPGN